VEPLVAILAGGRGSRIGGSKAMVELGGRPLIAYPLQAAEEASRRVAVIAKEDTALPPLTVPVVREPSEPVHPLCGIAAALREAAGNPVVAIGCDMPFISPGAISWLLSLPGPVAVPELDGRLHPLFARYSSAALEPLSRAIERETALQDAVRELNPRLLSAEEMRPLGDPQELLFNVNTEADLKRAKTILRERP
jgi:molybdopterin-guanine dinucleotide biosynthesis protein A